MKKNIRENTIKSFFGNLVANAVISTTILWNATVILLKDDNASFIKNTIPPLFFSIVVTSLITFFTLTNGRKKGEINLPISPNASWFVKALLNGIVVGFCFAIIIFGLIAVCQNIMVNSEIPKLSFILFSALFCAILASLASIILAKRAAQIK